VQGQTQAVQSINQINWQGAQARNAKPRDIRPENAQRCSVNN